MSLRKYEEFFRPLTPTFDDERFQLFYESMMNAIMSIVSKSDTTLLYHLSDKRLTKKEFDNLLYARNVIQKIEEFSIYDPTFINLALYPTFPGEPSLHDKVIQKMPLIYYTLSKDTNPDTDEVTTVLTKGIIVFQYTVVNNQYVLVSYFTEPMLM